MNINYWWDIILAIILGSVEGLTEFLPVSSTGHMILFTDLITQHDEKIKTFEVVVQLGSIIAVIFAFKDRIASILTTKFHPNKLNPIHILIGMIPASLLGFLCIDFINNYLFSTTTVIIGLIWGGLLMIVAQRAHNKKTSTSLDNISYNQAFWVGCFQCFSLWPGFSRSGSTISGGILAGLDYKTASEFSFILAIPMMLGASTLKLIKSWQMLSVQDLPFFLTGLFTAWLVALLVIKTFLKIIVRVKLKPFAIYRFILAFLLIILSYMGLITTG